MNTATLSVQGMSCGHCVKHVAQAIHSVPGVAAAEVQIGSASVQLRPGTAPEAVLSALREAGYEAHLTSEGASS